MIYGRSLFHSEYPPPRRRPAPSPPGAPRSPADPRRPRQSGPGVNFLYCRIIERGWGAAHSQASPDRETRPGKPPVRLQACPGGEKGRQVSGGHARPRLGSGPREGAGGKGQAHAGRTARGVRGNVSLSGASGAQRARIAPSR